MTLEISKLQQVLDEKDHVSQQNMKNIQMAKDELAEQLRIAKTSEVSLRKTFNQLQSDFLEKEKILKNYDEKFKLAEDSLKLFYVTLKYKEDQINMEKV